MPEHRARAGRASRDDDQILYTLNNLHIASLNADVEAGHLRHAPVKLMHHAEDMLNVHTLTWFFAELRPGTATAGTRQVRGIR